MACFLGIIAIFVVDGYLGIYDTIYLTAGEREQKIEADFWLQREGNEGWRQDWYGGTWTNWGDKVLFRYEVDNRQFSTYSANIEVSVERSQQKVQGIISQPITVASFDQGQLTWIVDTEKLKPDGTTPEQPYEFSVVIKRGELERRIILYINPSPVKPIPAPPR